MVLEMLLSLKSLSKSRWKCRSSVVHDERNRVAAEEAEKAREEEEGSRSKACTTTLTVWRKSLLFNCCSGFTVIDCNGILAYRVDNYIGQPGELVLMDAHGKCILTVRRRKNLSLVHEWLIYEGEASNDNSLESLTKRHSYASSANNKQTKQKKRKPAYHVKKHLSILQASSNHHNDKGNNALAHVYPVGTKAGDQDHISCKRPCPDYVIEGSYNKRSCRVMECSNNDGRRKRVVAEIKAKEAINGSASFGLEVFRLIVWPGFDLALAMTLVLLLDQMFA